MRIITNFTSDVSRWARWTAAAIWLCAGALLTGSVMLFIVAQGATAESVSLRERYDQLESRRAEVKMPAGMPSVGEITDLRQRVSAVNAISVTRGARFSHALALLEELLPADAWLSSVHHRGREGEIVLVAESEQTEELTRFLLALEKSSKFSEVLLLRQMPSATDGKRRVQFEIRLKERS